MAKKNYSDYTREQLITELQKLSKRKKYGLVWEQEKTKEQFEEDSLGKLPMLTEDKSRIINTDDSKPINILIEGDNFHALSVLNYTHPKNIDLIYIDPPFNTGAKDWRYNNDYVEKDDPYKHSKWLSMMSKRLSLAKKLLKKDGSLICAIDDYELNTLGLLLEDIFPGYEIDLIIVEHHPQGAGSDTISRTHEYAYVVTPKGVGLKGRISRDGESNWSLKRSGQGENNWRINRHKQFYAIIVDKEERRVVGVGPELDRDDTDFAKAGVFIDKETKKEYIRIYPIDKNGKERCWRYNRTSMLRQIKKNRILYTAKGSLVVKKNNVSAVPVFSIWRGTRYNAGIYGSGLLTEIMGEANTFPYPKSIYNIYDMISMIVGNNPEAIVLDFFAGSATTAHALLELNKEDEGERRFILCSNNENNICEDVTYVRIKRVIEGYNFVGKHKDILFEKRITPSVIKGYEKLKLKLESIIDENSDNYDSIEQKVEDGNLILYGVKEIKGVKEGFGGNLKYYKTTFVNSESTHRNKKLLTEKSIEMLCIRENTFLQIFRNKDISIFKNSDKYTAILFNETKLDVFKNKIKTLIGVVSVYVFSLEGDDFLEEFSDMKNNITLCSIPEAILKVYRRIYESAKYK